MSYISNRLEIAYLPDIKNCVLSEVDLKELNAGYEFASNNRCRSFCTYSFLIPFIESRNYLTRLVPVIDFPEGINPTPQKIFEAGTAYEACKKSSASEIDVVLHPMLYSACLDIKEFTRAKVNSKIGIKYIIELGHRNQEDVYNIVAEINRLPDCCQWIKTNTGKKGTISFEKKLELVKDLRNRTTYPIKVSGGIENVDQIKQYIDVCGENTIFGISYSKIKNWSNWDE